MLPVGPYIEHINMTTESIEQTKEFLLCAFPNWRVRGKGYNDKSENKRHWMHVGDDVWYVALESANGQKVRRPYYNPGINHVGFVVNNLKEIAERLLKNGYKEGIKAENHPFRKRMYFYDNVGNEFEFVEYNTMNPRERNDYTFSKL